MRGKRKPNFKPTKGQRDQVMLLVAMRMSEEGIAAAIGICRNTLRKFFAHELEIGHSRKMAENLARLEKAARYGNVTAMKYLDTRANVVPPQAAQPKPEPLGKKEAATRAAQTAHEETEWGNLLN